MSDKFLVDIKDFQSLKSVHLDIPKGVCIITGSTNNGKSAVFRAIDSALFNLGDDSMIRGGKRYYGVSIDNGTHKMVFMRDGVGKNEKSAYQFDGGNVQKKVGRSQLSEVASMFNIRDVRMQNGSKMKINFWYQNDKPFLMDKTSGQLYEFLSLSSCDKYSKVLKTMKADSKVLDADIASITAEIDTLKVINNKKQDFIDKNKGFDSVYKKTVIMSQDNRRINEELNLVNSIKDIKEKIDRVKLKLEEVSKKYESVPIEYLSDKFKNISERSSDIKESVYTKGKVAQTEVEIERTRSKLNSIREKFRLSSSSVLSMQSNIQKVDKEYKDVHTMIREVSKIKESKNNIDSCKDAVHSIESRVFDKVEDVEEKVSLADKDSKEVKNCAEIINLLKECKCKIKESRDSLVSIDQNIKSNEEDLESLKMSIGYCPFCGTVFEKE